VSRDAHPTSTARALWLHVKPTFLLPPVATSVFGGLLAATFDVEVAFVHAVAVARAMYVAHLVDGYVDYYRRGEDASNPLSRAGVHVAVLATSALFGGCLLTLWAVGGSFSVLLTVPLWVLAVSHAPYLDTNPVAVTFDYAVGVALVICGGFAAQTRTLTFSVVCVALLYVPLLGAAKVLVDAIDYEGDAALSKRTLLVVLGRRWTHPVSAGLVAFTGCLVVAAVSRGVFPPTALVALAFPLFATLGGFMVTLRTSVRLQMVSTALFSVTMLVVLS